MTLKRSFKGRGVEDSNEFIGSGCVVLQKQNNAEFWVKSSFQKLNENDFSLKKETAVKQI
jgi:hypothetical protein